MRKKLFTLLLAIVASLGTLFAESGTCGANLTWDLTDGVLTVSGWGTMKEYNSSSSIPWNSKKSSIKTIIIEDGVESICEFAFSSCKYLVSLTIGNTVTTIGKWAFSNCSGLSSVSIPNSVVTIGSHAFYECKNLKKLTIGNGVIDIEDYAFRSCSNLTSVKIPNSVLTIGESAFYQCNNLTSATIGNRVTNIGDWAFGSCGLIDINIPNSVTNIGEFAFTSCSSLLSVRIGNRVSIIGSGAFSDCNSLTGVYITDFTSWCEISFGDFRANPLCYARHIIDISGNFIDTLTIPNRVTNIGNYAFYNCSDLTLVNIPNSVTSIGSYAFYGCSGLMVIYPDNVTSIGSYAFYGCSSLTGITTPKVTSIGERAFYNCCGLTGFYIGESVTSIGYNAFYGCSGLKEVYIADLSAWCKISFYDYYANPLSYAHYIHHNGNIITDLVIPNSVTSIGKYVFVGCYGLTSVTIPNDVTSIGDYTFQNCSGLKDLYVNSIVPPKIESNTLTNSNILVHVSFSCLGQYLSAEYWKNMHYSPCISQNSSVSPTAFSVTFDTEGINLQSCGISGGEQQAGNVLEYIGLEPSSEYKDIPILLNATNGESTTLEISFTTPALELTTKASKPVSSTTAILLAETNMSDAEVSCGFEYKRNDAPVDMEGNKVYCPVASGQMAGRLKGLKDDVYYKYRAFYQSAAGNMFYGDWQYIFTGDVAVEFDPILYTYGATVVRENEATISGYALAGSEDFTEQGFEYWAESRVNGQSDQVPSTKGTPRRMPAALNEHFFVQASGIALHATLTNLDAGTVYKYRVYGKVGDQYYYGSEQSFATQGEYEGDDSEAIEEVPSDQVPSTKAQKILRNGQIYILRGEKEYTLTGQEVR